MHFPAHNGKAVHIKRMSCRLAVLVNEEGALKCFLRLSWKLLPNSPIYSSSQPAWVHQNFYIIPLFWVVVSMGATKRVQMVLWPLIWTCITNVLHIFLKLSVSPLVYGTTRNMLWLFVLSLLLMVCCLLFGTWAWLVLNLWYILVCSLLGPMEDNVGVPKRGNCFPFLAPVSLGHK